MTSLSLHRLRDDDGISLVEIMVGMSIIMISLAAFASTITQSLAVIRSDEQTVRGNQFAAEVLEFTQAFEFDCQGDATCVNTVGELGFYENDPGWSSTASDGEPMVSLGTTRPQVGSPATASPGPLPLQTVNRDGIDYTVQQEVVWIDDPAEPGTQDFKEVRVAVEWMIDGTTYRASTATQRYDTPAPILTCTPGEITEVSISPDFVTITASGNNLDAIVVTVETCTPAETVTLTPTPLTIRGMQEVPGSDGTRWEVRDISDGNVQFQPNTYEWVVAMTSLDGDDEERRDVVFAQEVAQTLAIDSIAASPTTLCLRKSGSQDLLNAAVPVTIRLSGAKVGDAVSLRWTGAPDGTVNGTVNGVDTNGVAQITLTIPINTPFTYKPNGGGNSVTVTTTTLTATVTRNSSGTPVTRSAVADLRPNGTAPC